MSFNSKENQNCWNCNHFQRYAIAGKYIYLHGECRAHAQSEQKSDSLLSLYNWPFVKDGTSNWCGNWQKSVLDVPDPPTVVDPPEWPEVWERWFPWNVKADANVKCWNCSHFQRDFDIPITQNGVCAKQTPSIANGRVIATNSDNLNPTQRLNYPGTLYWCGDWQASEVAVPAAPAVADTTRPDSWIDISGGEITWIIDGLNGDDEFGDGSSDKPFKSFKCLRSVSEKLYSKVTLKPKAGAYDSFEEILAFRGRGGYLVIDATGEVYPVLAGPYTVTTVSGVGAVGPGGLELATDLQVGGAPGWTIDDYYGKFIHLLNGAFAGQTVAIYANDADTVRTHQDFFSFAIGTEFNIVEEPVEINVDHPISIHGDTELRQTEFYIGGVRFNIDSVYTFDLSNLIAVFTFCTLNNPNNTHVLKMNNSVLNNTTAPAGAFDNGAMNGTYCNSLVITANDGDPELNEYRAAQYYGGSCDIGMMLSRGYVVSIHTETCSVGYSLLGGVQSLGGANNLYIDVFLEQKSHSDIAITVHDGYAYLSSVYVFSADRALEVSNSGGLRIAWFQGGVMADDYAAILRPFSKVRVIGADCTIVGAVGAVEFSFDSSVNVAWPGAGVAYDDTAGSYCLRE